MVSSSNLACIFDTIRDIGEHLSDKDAARRKSGYLLYNVISMHPFLDGNKRTA
jgi:fido (protein-threonine AMPylation protein)